MLIAINLFDANFYRAANPNLVAAGLTTNEQFYKHFQESGLKEGRAFSLFVDLNYYRASNPDLVMAGLNSDSQLLNHLQASGVAEGRKISPFVDTNFYLATNSDVNQAFGGNREQALRHLIGAGVSEGRIFSPFVNINYYLFANADVNQYFSGNRMQAFQHLVMQGLNEGRQFSPFVDLKLYKALNLDVNQAFGENFRQVFQHLTTEGILQGRRFSLAYDSAYYKAVNPDLASFDNLQLLQHFQLSGLNEGRASSASFNVRHYLRVNTDVARAGYNNQQAFQHFIISGFCEGREGAPAITLNGRDPGNDMSNAFNLEFLTSSRSYTNFVGNSDKSDFYRFDLSDTRNINIIVNGVTEAIDLDLIQDTNSNGVYDNSDHDYNAYGSKNYPASINKTLGNGTYFIRIKPDSDSGNTNYTLNLSSSSAYGTTPKDPGDTLATALPIALGQSWRDFVGIADLNDYYKFSLDRTNNVNLSVNGVTEGVDLYLIQDTNGNGVYDDSDNNYYNYGSSSSSASISKTLGSGTYFIRVKAAYDTNTNYNLSLSGSPAVVTTPKDPGSNFATALPIAFNQSWTDFVGINDLNDYYSFTIGSTRNVTVTLSGLTEGADLYLIQDTYGDGIYDKYDIEYQTYGSSSSSASISKTLESGNYFIRVKPDYANGNTNYTVQLRSS